MADHEPPYLSVGTEVSAKYRGAFCEAKVKKVVRSVKCRVTFKETGNSAVVNDDIIKGTVRTGSVVEVRHPESGQYVEATIMKTTDSSMYTVVFDDGDERTLRRTMLCLKGNKHFVESETLDQLPLTHPEHFGTPVMQKKDKRRSSNFSGVSSESEDSVSDDDSPSKRRTYCGKLADCIGKVVCAGAMEKRKTSWFPALVVLPSAADVTLKTKGHLLVRSFKDNKFSAVLKKETKDFTREIALRKSDDKTLKAAIEKALLYLDNHELPTNWNLTSLLGSDTEEVSEAETSDDEPSEEKDRFVAQLFKFMDDRGTPINKAPTIGMKDLNLYRLYRLVKKYGGFNKVTSQMRWRLIYSKMSLPSTNVASTSIMQAYKKYLHAFEHFDRRLGSNLGSSSRPHRSRNMLPFRDRDKHDITRSPRKRAVAKESTPTKESKEQKEPSPSKDEAPRTPTNESKGKPDDSTPKRNLKLPPIVKATTRSDNKKGKTPTPEKNETETVKPKMEPKKLMEPKKIVLEKKEPKKKEEKKAFVKLEVKKEVEEKAQSQKEAQPLKKVEEEIKPPAAPAKVEKKIEKKEVVKKETKVEEVVVVPIVSKGRRGSKKLEKSDVTREEDSENDMPIEVDEDDMDMSDNSSMTSQSGGSNKGKKKSENHSIGTKLGVRYGRGRHLKIYEAKIVDSNTISGVIQYRVHYNGWNIRYDEWIKKDRIVYVLPDDKHTPIGKPPTAPPSPKKTPISLAKPVAIPKHTHPLLTSSEPSTSPPAAPAPSARSPGSAENKKAEEPKKTEKAEPEVDTEATEDKAKKEDDVSGGESPSGKPPRPTRSNSIETKAQITANAKTITRRSRRLSGHMDDADLELRVSESEDDEEPSEEVAVDPEQSAPTPTDDPAPEDPTTSEPPKETHDPSEDINLQCTEEFEPMQIEETEETLVAVETLEVEQELSKEETVETTDNPEEKTTENPEPELEDEKVEPEVQEAQVHEEKSKSVMSNLDAILEAAGHYNDADDEEFFSMYGPTSTEERKRKRKPKKKDDEQAKKRAKKKKKEEISVMTETPPTSPEGSSPGRGNLSPEEEQQSTKSEHEANIEVAHYMTTLGNEVDSPNRESPKDQGLKRKPDAEKGATPKKIKRTYKSKKQTHASDSEDYEAPTSVAHPSSSVASVVATSSSLSSPYKKSSIVPASGKRSSPKISKYNFYLDDSAEELARDQRIAILQSRIGEIRKIYMELKSEVALIDRRRKRARRKEREAEREAAAALLQQTSQMMASQAQVASMS